MANFREARQPVVKVQRAADMPYFPACSVTVGSNRSDRSNATSPRGVAQPYSRYGNRKISVIPEFSEMPDHSPQESIRAEDVHLH